VLHYKRRHFTADGLSSPKIAEEFLVHANEEPGHADRLAKRIVQLGGKPDFSPDSPLQRSHAASGDSTELKDMIRADLVAERVAIEAYSLIIALIGDKDSTTRRLLEDTRSASGPTPQPTATPTVTAHSTSTANQRQAQGPSACRRPSSARLGVAGGLSPATGQPGCRSCCTAYSASSTSLRTPVFSSTRAR